ncbi:MAG TPA: 2-C-methyl-D-erythritol 4-phosphate cytidylyltransferase [Spirochaetota bacterium]|nr:2-C-methyl-D-erythritol 4-phosphate cytidylyltransferase [Spirochaetota bacterium]
MKKKLTAVILAAGKGSRFGGKTPKTFLTLNGKPIFYYSIYSFYKIEEVDSIYLVVSNDMLEYSKILQKKYLNKIEKFQGIITGGKERSDSVFNALKSLSSNTEYIALHDAARPFIKPKLIIDIFNEALKVGGASCGMPPIDTIKSLDKDRIIDKHLKRDSLIAIQTPQIFKYDLLFEAYKNAINNNNIFTDDTEVFALSGNKISIINGDKDLIKITYKEDLNTALKIYKGIKYLWI